MTIITEMHLVRRADCTELGMLLMSRTIVGQKVIEAIAKWFVAVQTVTPPLCLTCDDRLATLVAGGKGPGAFFVLMSSPEEAMVMGLCDTCAEGDRAALMSRGLAKLQKEKAISGVVSEGPNTIQ